MLSETSFADYAPPFLGTGLVSMTSDSKKLGQISQTIANVS